MFEDSLFATNPRRNPQRGWAAVLSFVVQAGFVTVLVGLPLFFTEALPLDSARNYILLPAPPTSAPPPPPREAYVRTQPASDMVNGQVIFHEIPKGAPKRIVDAVAPPQWTGTGPYVPGATGTGSGDSVISNIIEGAGRGIPLPKPAAPSKPIIVSRMSEGLLIHKVTPEYPSIARIAHQQGTVLLHAIIGRDGTIQQLQAISGPPMLIGAAIQAVQQWRYRPYILNGQPVEVETQITVNFKLGS